VAAIALAAIIRAEGNKGKEEREEKAPRPRQRLLDDRLESLSRERHRHRSSKKELFSLWRRKRNVVRKDFRWQKNDTSTLSAPTESLRHKSVIKW